jgi:tetratricopeptide (TPR) repeat protein
VTLDGKTVHASNDILTDPLNSTMKYKRARNPVLVWLALVAMTLTVRASQQQSTDSLGQARALYESAEYEKALAAMEQIDSVAMTREQARDRALYQALCLLALNRRSEAESRIEEVLQAQPLLRLEEDGMPPRLRAIVDDVRGRIAPALAQQHYRLGKSHFDRADYDRALQDFTLVLQLLEDLNAPSGASDLADIKTLAAGFGDLARRSLASTDDTPTPPPPVISTRSESETIVPPVTIRQQIPRYQPVVGPTSELVLRGLVDILIGPSGDVQSVTIVKSIEPRYDSILITAAKQWKYRPATQSGKPVEFLKRLVIDVKAK